MIKLSILIPHTTKYVGFLERLEERLYPQMTDEVEVIRFIDDGVTYNKKDKDYIKKSIGHKRNQLLYKASGEYLQFLDSDDLVSENYISLQMEGINLGVDCCSLKGIITEDGKNPKVFEHSIKYKEYKTNDKPVNGVTYERYPNHLNCIKSSIAKQFTFPEINHGEDTDWATQIFKSGMIKTEHYIDQAIYYYEYRSKK